MKTAKKIGFKSSRVTVNMDKIVKIKRNAGSCIGVKYPCAYHCKKCIFDTIYCK